MRLHELLMNLTRQDEMAKLTKIPGTNRTTSTTTTERPLENPCKFVDFTDLFVTHMDESFALNATNNYRIKIDEDVFGDIRTVSIF